MKYSSAKKIPALIFTLNTTSLLSWNGAPRIDGETARINISRLMAAKMLRGKRKARRLAMSDELFTPEVIELDTLCGLQSALSSEIELPAVVPFTNLSRSKVPRLTVRQKEKHFRVRRFIEVPAWNEDTDFYTENECNIL